MGKTFQPDSMPGYKLPVYEYRKPPELEGTSHVYPVIVVGAGLAGLAAALELAARGIRTLLLDDDNTVGASGLSSRGICYAKRTLEIRVFDAQDELTAVAPRVRPREERGARPADVEIAGGARREAGTNLHG